MGYRPPSMRPRTLIATPHRRLATRLIAAFAVLAALGLAAIESPDVALLLAPALLIVLVLAVGVFPGEEAIARARARRMRARPSRAPGRILRPALPDVARPAGAALAFALAMRPPPAVAAGH
jgi:hypothetical protein